MGVVKEYRKKKLTGWGLAKSTGRRNGLGGCCQRIREEETDWVGVVKEYWKKKRTGWGLSKSTEEETDWVGKKLTSQNFPRGEKMTGLFGKNLEKTDHYTST